MLLPLLFAALTSQAQEFQGLSFVGDGTTPSATQLLDDQRVSPSVGRFAISSSRRLLHIGTEPDEARRFAS